MEAAESLSDVDGLIPGVVLVADADPKTRGDVARRLNEAGYVVVTAADGDEALRVTVEQTPDLLVLDAAMPLLDGLAVCRQVQALGPIAPPVIFMTADGQAPVGLDGFAVGVADFITKPLHAPELVARVDETLRSTDSLYMYAHGATTDPLTGLLNRRGLEVRANEAVAIASRHGRPLACLFVDLDHFKLINDTYGHATGDLALKAAAELIRSGTRISDIVARYGGDEFILLLLETGRDGALATADKIRHTLAEYRPQDGPDTGFLLRASVGVACWDAGMTGADELYAAADRALYEAKSLGRDAIAIAASPSLANQD